MDNFRAVSAMLSQSGSVFEKYCGIEPSGAHRKFNAIIKEVAKLFLTEDGEIVNEQGAVGFESVALAIIRDMVDKERQKNAMRITKSGKNSLSALACQGNVLLRKRKADIVPVKSAMRKAAKQEVVMQEEEEPEAVVPRVDYSTHKAALQALTQQYPHAGSVLELLKAADISQAGIADFSITTKIKPEKPVARLLRLFEEVMDDRDYVARTKTLLGMDTADALELDAFLRPFYG